MNNKNVNTTIESSEIETKGRKSARAAADKVLTFVLVVCALIFAVSCIILVSAVKEEKRIYSLTSASDIMSIKDSFRTGRIVLDVAETKSYGQAEAGEYVLPYSIAGYEEAALKAYAYRTAGDTEKAEMYERIMIENRNKMEYSIYADEIDKRYLRLGAVNE